MSFIFAAAADSVPFLHNFSFGSFGLLEVSALTPFIRSSAAESLILGNKGAAGLAWAALSAFSSISVIEGCISGASAGWLRELLTIRSPASDLAVGMQLSLDQTSRTHVEPVGIKCDAGATLASNKAELTAIYAFDYSTQSTLQTIPERTAGHVHMYADHEFIPSTDSRFHFLAIALSSLKLAEVYILWALGGHALACATALSWAYFSTAALVLHLHQRYLYFNPASRDRHSIDVIAGHLPNSKSPGGFPKIVLGAIANYRMSLINRIVWGVGALVCIGSLGTTFLLLDQVSTDLVNIWVIFQITWLACRIFFNYFTKSIDWMAHRMLRAHPWQTLPINMKERVFNLILGISRYQASIHPRRLLSYKEELSITHQFINLLSAYPLHTAFPFELPSGGIELDIVAVLGDTLLSSAAWAFGLGLNSMDLYDSCVVILRVVPQPGSTESLPLPARTIAIPSARVLSGQPERVPDAENNRHPQFVPKGSSNSGTNLTWWYWIPCGENRWLQLSSQDMKFLGKRQAELLTDDELTATLAKGLLNIDLVNVEYLRAIVKHSNLAAGVLFN